MSSKSRDPKYKILPTLGPKICKYTYIGLSGSLGQDQEACASLRAELARSRNAG